MLKESISSFAYWSSRAPVLQPLSVQVPSVTTTETLLGVVPVLVILYGMTILASAFTALSGAIEMSLSISVSLYSAPGCPEVPDIKDEKRIEDYGTVYGIQPELIEAIVEVESWGTLRQETVDVSD